MPQHIIMTDINPYETPRSFAAPLPLNRRGNMYRRVTAAALLGIVGYGIYFGSVLAVSCMDSSVSPHDTSWTWGGIVAFACAASEWFAVEAWSLNKYLLRRLIVSTTITIASLLISDQLCVIGSIELGRDGNPLFLPRLGLGLPIFVGLTLIIRQLSAQHLAYPPR